MEDLRKMAATLPDYEDDVPMFDFQLLTPSPEAAPPSDETKIDKNPSTTVTEVLSGILTDEQGFEKVCPICNGKYLLRDSKEFRVMRAEGGRS